jgi:hypothetical protein
MGGRKNRVLILPLKDTAKRFHLPPWTKIVPNRVTRMCRRVVCRISHSQAPRQRYFGPAAIVEVNGRRSVILTRFQNPDSESKMQEARSEVHVALAHYPALGNWRWPLRVPCVDESAPHTLVERTNTCVSYTVLYLCVVLEFPDLGPDHRRGFYARPQKLAQHHPPTTYFSQPKSR